MTKYIEVYLNYFDLGEQDIITCESCLKQGRVDGEGFDIHHIHGRGDNNINNLICLCRSCHARAHTSKKHIKPEEFQHIHNCFLANKKIFIANTGLDIDLNKEGI